MNEEINKKVYLQALDEIPYKLMSNKKIWKMLENKCLKPLHGVIIPTNKCNLDCIFCNCRNRNKDDELKITEIYEIIDILQKEGADAITFSGGGEPLLYKQIAEVIKYTLEKGMQIGLVTNGVFLNRLMELDANSLSWIRVSFGDGRKIEEAKKIIANIKLLIKKKITRYAGLSYVVTENKDQELIDYLVSEVNTSKIDYIKFIKDQYLDGENEWSNSFTVSDKILVANPMGHKNYGKCLLYLVKPIFNADGNVYPCCDIQYDSKVACYSGNKAICHYSQYSKKRYNQEELSVKCNSCYHNMMNDYLQLALKEIPFSSWI